MRNIYLDLEDENRMRGEKVFGGRVRSRARNAKASRLTYHALLVARTTAACTTHLYAPLEARLPFIFPFSCIQGPVPIADDSFLEHSATNNENSPTTALTRNEFSSDIDI